MNTNLFLALAKKLKKISGLIQNKPKLELDDFVLEHFLVYNNLVGSSPDNQKDFKHVRADIVEAINRDSSHELAIALKLPPLLWEDRLEKIFAEIASVNLNGAIKCLMSPKELTDSIGDTSPFSHRDWRVRANASKMLAFLSAKEAIPIIIQALNDKSIEQKSGFVHHCLALGKLGGKETCEALKLHLQNAEPWFQLDALTALAMYPKAEIETELMLAILNPYTLSDYMAVSIVKHHRLIEFCQSTDNLMQEGSCELAFNLLKALKGPFQSDNSIKEQLNESIHLIETMSTQNPSPRKVNTFISIQKFLLNKTSAEFSELIQIQYRDSIKEILNSNPSNNSQELTCYKHALSLAQEYKLSEIATILLSKLNLEFPALPELIETLASFTDETITKELAQKLQSILNNIYDLSSRSNKAFLAHPLEEENDRNSHIYWCILKAFSLIPEQASMDTLVLAINDYAPDKREQALLSLQTLCLANSMQKICPLNLEELIKERLKDPALKIRIAALKGIAQHQLIQLLPEIKQCLLSKDPLLRKESLETIKCLSKNIDHHKEVKSYLESNLNKEKNSEYIQRFENALNFIN